MTDALEHYRYADAARTLYDFAWNEFCSFYVEMTKARFARRRVSPRLESRLGETRHVIATAGVLAHALDVLLRLLHPMMPFLTEEVWQLLAQVAPERGLSREPSPSPSLKGRGTRRRVFASRRGRSPTRRGRMPTIEAAVRRFPGRARRGARDSPAAEYSFKEELTFTVRCDAAHGQAACADAAVFHANGPRHGHRLGTRCDRARRAASVTLAGRTARSKFTST